MKYFIFSFCFITIIFLFNSILNKADTIEQLESQFSRGDTDPTTSSETYLDNGDLFYNTNTNQLKVYRDGAWQILLEAEGDMDTLDGSTF